ncbi:hypothetical protein, conserved [Babesia ovata]|uniref:Extracellular matrix-binding ebh n=1 Tax=Babesia ovata TaxID=189622 RepID=A0A2H6KJD9_9APIC|nr:uncharacterized protein BOVATA_046080 [Babesia ovata]GBE63115.1 hypothetical protein, conserved [Babesia ovata]
MGLIGGSDDVKNAILKGLHSNVTQLEKLLKASCGGEGCCDNNLNDLQKSLSDLQQNCKQYDALQTQINSLKKDVAEKSEAPERAPSDSGPEIERLTREIEELKNKIFSQSSTLKDKITIVIDAVKIVIESLDAKKNKVVDAQSQVNELKKKIEGNKNNVERLKKDLDEREEQLKNAKNEFPEKESKSLEYHNASMKSLETLKELCGYAEKVDNNKNNPSATLLNNLCTGLENFLGYHDGNYTGEGIVYSDLDRLCDGVMSFLHGVLSGVKDDDNVTTYDVDKVNNISTLPEKLAITEVSNALRAWSGELEERTYKLKTALSDLQTSNFKYITDSLNKLNSVYGDSLRNVPALLQTCFNEAKNLHDVFKLAKTYYMDLDPTLKDKLKDSFDYINLQVKEFAAAAQNTELKALLVFSEERAKLLEKTVNDKVKYRTNQLGSDINDAFERQIGKPIDDVNEKLTAVHADLGKWIVAAEKFIQMIHNQVDDIINEVMSSAANPCGISTAAGKLKEDAVKLYTEMQEAHGYIAERVQSALGVVDAALKTAVMSDLKQLRDKIKQTVGEHISRLGLSITSNLKDLTDTIAHQQNKSGTLYDIQNALQGYASSFENKLKDAIETMVTSMVNEKGGAVDTYVGKYVIDKGNSSLLNGKENDIKAAILHYLPDIIKQLVEESAGKAGLSSTAEFSQIGSSLQDFAKRFGKQIKSELSGKTKLEEIAEQIAGMVATSGSTKNDYLQTALEIIIFGVSTAAKGLSEEIKNFLEASKISNLAQAIESVKTLGEKLENAVTRAVVPSTGAFKERLKAQAEGLIGTEYGNGSGDFKNGNGFTPTYDTAKLQVTQPLDLIQNNGSGLKKIKTVMADEKGSGMKIESSTLQELHSIVTQSLEQLCKRIEKLAGKDSGYSGVKQKLQRLSNIIKDKLYGEEKHSLTGIQTRLNKILTGSGDNTLQTIVQNAGEFYDKIIKTEAARAIKEIQQCVSDEVAKVTGDIQKEAKTDYHFRINKMFTDMETRVHFAITSIKRTIHEDSHGGVKGLLKTMKHHIDPLKEITPGATHPANFQSLSAKSLAYLKHIHTYVSADLPKHLPNSQYPSQLSTIHSALTTLLSHLSAKKHFDHKVPGMLAELKTSVQALHTTNFANPAYPVLDAFPKSLVRFVEQLERGYVNRYEGHPSIDFEKLLTKKTITNTNENGEKHLII